MIWFFHGLSSLLKLQRRSLTVSEDKQKYRKLLVIQLYDQYMKDPSVPSFYFIYHESHSFERGGGGGGGLQGWYPPPPHFPRSSTWGLATSIFWKQFGADNSEWVKLRLLMSPLVNLGYLIFIQGLKMNVDKNELHMNVDRITWT